MREHWFWCFVMLKYQKIEDFFISLLLLLAHCPHAKGKLRPGYAGKESHTSSAVTEFPYDEALSSNIDYGARAGSYSTPLACRRLL